GQIGGENRQGDGSEKADPRLASLRPRGSERHRKGREPRPSPRAQDRVGHVEGPLLPVWAHNLDREGVREKGAVGGPPPRPVGREEEKERRGIRQVAAQTKPTPGRGFVPVNEVLPDHGEAEGPPEQQGIGTEEYRETKGQAGRPCRGSPQRG